MTISDRKKWEICNADPKVTEIKFTLSELAEAMADITQHQPYYSDRSYPKLLLELAIENLMKKNGIK